MVSMSGATGYSPDALIIDRFGLNSDFIEAQGLSWTNNLITSSGEDLANSKHSPTCRITFSASASARSRPTLLSCALKPGDSSAWTLSDATYQTIYCLILKHSVKPPSNKHEP